LSSVYIETTIPSYLTAWPAKNLIAAAHQAITKEWWELRRTSFELFTSELVLSEAAAGDREAAKLRLEVMEGIPVLLSNDRVEWISDELVRDGLIPSSAAADAIHIAIAAVHRMTYLLTWNCRHIANAEKLPQIERFLARNHFHVPVVCTPEELLGDSDGDNS
jgi:predicted nucleic acid-binding protein